MRPQDMAGGLPCPPSLRPFRPLTAPDMAPVWGPRMSMHWGGLVDLGLTEAQGSQGPPEASWPCPSTGALYTVVLTGPSIPGTHQGLASANKSGSRTADSWTLPIWRDGPWPFLWSPSPDPHALGCAFLSIKGKLLAEWVGV